MSEQEQLAREWAVKYLKYADEDDSPELYAAAHVVTAHTTPPTMDKVEWDSEKHALAGAAFDTGNGQVDVVMLAKDAGIIDYATLDGKFGYEHCSYFTPNGKRYRLVEVGATVSPDEKVGPDQPDHPATLTTFEDYGNAPLGTVVSGADGSIWSKAASDDWITLRASLNRLDRHMTDAKRQVLRWGWGE